MALSDRMKDLRDKAEEAVVEHGDQLREGVQKAGEAADRRTGGKYSEQIQNVGERAIGVVDSIEQSRKGEGSDGTAVDTRPGA